MQFTLYCVRLLGYVSVLENRSVVNAYFHLEHMISQTWWSSVGSILQQAVVFCVNYLKKISQTWWSCIRSILK